MKDTPPWFVVVVAAVASIHYGGTRVHGGGGGGGGDISLCQHTRRKFRWIRIHGWSLNHGTGVGIRNRAGGSNSLVGGVRFVQKVITAAAGGTIVLVITVVVVVVVVVVVDEWISFACHDEWFCITGTWYTVVSIAVQSERLYGGL